MEREDLFNSIDAHLISSSSLTIKDRLKNLFGLPKPINNEYIDDNEQTSWCM